MVDLTVMAHVYGDLVTLNLKETSYHDGNPALVVTDAKTGEPWGKLSVNLPEVADVLRPGEFFVKTYSENQQLASIFAPYFEETAQVHCGPGPRFPVWRWKGD